MLSERESNEVKKILDICIFEVENHSFPEKILENYYKIFSPHRIHFAGLDDRGGAVFFEGKGPEDYAEMYAKFGEYDLSRPHNRPIKPSNPYYFLDKETIQKLAKNNPFYDNALNVHHFTDVITTVHPSQKAFIGIWKNPDADRMLNLHELHRVIGTKILHSYHRHKKLYRYHNVNKSLISILRRVSGHPWAVMDQYAEVFAMSEDLPDLLSRKGVDLLELRNRSIHARERLSHSAADNVVFFTRGIPCRMTPFIAERQLLYFLSVIDHDLYDSLTPREKEIAYYMTQGKTNGEIAKITCISIETVKRHLSTIFSKLKVRNRVEAVILLRLRLSDEQRRLNKL